ncbi:MAG: ABC transporter substrate-binding protein [Chitinophagales bacterium]|nr:ABC transporter substrate-binding protein [Chitinophagales bacterium]
MTSAPNRLLPLNGNNFLPVLFTFLALSTTTPLPLSQTKASVPVKNFHAFFLPASSRKTRPAEADSLFKRKHAFTIAILLPFGSSKVFINDLDDPSGYYFPEQSQLSVEYYQGAIIALDSLRNQGLDVKLLVRDIGLDTSQLRPVLEDPVFDSVDVMIGPIGNSGLRMTCEFSRNKGLWLISPFSVATKGLLPNPYYILANATLESHCEKIYKYISQRSFGKKICLVYRKQPGDLELVNYFKGFCRQLQDSNKIALQFLEINDSSTIKYTQIRDALSDSERNLIVIPSNDESFVKLIMKQLDGLTNEYLMDVFGMPTWINFNHIPKDQMVNVSTHITQNFWLDKSAPQVVKFKDAYAMKFNMNPTDYAVKGYDQMMYFGGLLLQQGTDFTGAFHKAGVPELAESFSIVPVMKDDSSNLILYNENKSVIMLQYTADSLIKVQE